MSQPARVYRILIAAPPDVSAARELVGRAILRWNNENFQDRRVVLLPLAWEAADEELGSTASLLRREVAGGCDLFIGLFWTRMTSLPGQDLTELLDQIEAQRRAGVPVLLFFSRQRVLLDEIDPHELARLKEFRSTQAKVGPIEEFSDLLQFREMIQRLLDQQIRCLLSAESLVPVAADIAATSRPSINVDVSLADPSSGMTCGDTLSLEAKYFEIRNFDQIPDYQRADGSGAPPPSLWGVMYNQANKEYYRDYIKYVFQGSMLRPVRLTVQNTGLIGLRDVRIEVTVTPLEGAVFCLRPEDRLVRPDKEVGLSESVAGGRGIGFPIDRFSTSLELGCLQPQRVLTPPALFLIGADRDVTCYVDLLIYADSLAEPLRRRLTLDLHVTRESVDALEFFEVLRER